MRKVVHAIAAGAASVICDGYGCVYIATGTDQQSAKRAACSAAGREQLAAALRQMAEYLREERDSRD